MQFFAALVWVSFLAKTKQDMLSINKQQKKIIKHTKHTSLKTCRIKGFVTNYTGIRYYQQSNPTVQYQEICQLSLALCPPSLYKIDCILFLLCILFCVYLLQYLLVLLVWPLYAKMHFVQILH